MSTLPLASEFLTSGATVFALVGIVIVIFLFFAIWSSRYTKAGPNQVLIISDRQCLHRNPDGSLSQRGYRIVKGGGSFVFPVIEKVDVLSLDPVTIEFQFDNVASGVAQVKVNSEDISIARAAEHFLNKGPDTIRDSALQIVESQCRKALNPARMEEQLARDLAATGLSLISFTVRSFNKSVPGMAGTGKPPVSVAT